LDQVTNPAGIRLGVQEMTRFGMKEPEMGMIADLFKKCLMGGKYVGDEVTKFRQDFQTVHYSFDDLKST
jgi:glycine hydroxymethyltransferase